MNQEAFNLSVRKFLKQFGVGAQREIEQAVGKALETGRIRGEETFHATATLRIDQLEVRFTTDGEITLA